MTRYYLEDTRDEINKWSVIDKKKKEKNPWNWRAAKVFTGSKKECNKWINEHESC